MQATSSKKYVGLLSGVLCISFSAIFVKLAAVDSTVSAFYRCFYSSIFLFGIALVRGELRGASWRWLVPALWGGLALAADLIIWHKTILYIGAGPATIMANSQVIFVTIFGFFFFKERISPWFPLLIPFIFLGLFLTIPTIQVLVSPGIGFFLGILVGIAYSGYLLGLRFAKMKAGKGYPEILSLAVFMAVTGAFVGTYGAVVEQVDFIVTLLEESALPGPDGPALPEYGMDPDKNQHNPAPLPPGKPAAAGTAHADHALGVPASGRAPGTCPDPGNGYGFRPDCPVPAQTGPGGIGRLLLLRAAPRMEHHIPRYLQVKY